MQHSFAARVVQTVGGVRVGAAGAELFVAHWKKAIFLRFRPFNWRAKELSSFGRVWCECISVYLRGDPGILSVFW